jgi:glycosyltransferase involved in cell wall biosynthesis
VVAGNISPGGLDYFNNLVRLVKHNDLQDFIKFKVNLTFEKMLEIMRSVKVYLHPLPGEPFGISTVEAMSAGIVPVVPDVGGHTEFVPQKYQFHTFGQGVEAVAAALDAPMSERIMISNSTQRYSMANYIKRFQQIVSNLIEIDTPKQRQVPRPIISLSKRYPESITTA